MIKKIQDTLFFLQGIVHLLGQALGTFLLLIVVGHLHRAEAAASVVYKAHKIYMK